MKKLIALSVFLSALVPAHADPLDTANFPLFGLGTTELEESGTLLIEELGLPGAIQTQSRAVELLGNEFSRAASQGLIDAQETPSRSTQSEISGALGDRSNLSVVTGIDRDILTSPNVPPTAEGAICISESKVDVAGWGDANDPKQLGKLRTQAIAENGDITTSGALRLARFYIALGFGAEAKAMVKHVKSSNDQELITALANIIDFGESDNDVLQGQIFCQGSVALWAALAKPMSAGEFPASTNDILKSFSKLPYHLRAHLGPLLAERFRKAGMDEQARNALNAILRSGAKSVESTLTSAKLGLTGTRPEVARQQLVELSNGTDVTAASALLELLEDAHRNNRKPVADWVEDVPSLVRATEGTDVAAKLNLAGLRGKISLHRFDDVRLALNEEGPGLTELTRAELGAKALAAATEFASDEEFLRSAIGLTKFFENSALSSSDRFALAQRLNNLGLSQQAALYLPDQPATIAERRTSSDVLSDIGDVSSAIAIIEEQPEDLLPELAGLQAQDGDVDQALESFSASGQVNAATFLAIQSGNWDWVTQNGIETAADATQALLSPLPSDADTLVNGALIKQAQTRRTQAERLLNSLNSDEFSEAFTN